MRVLKSIFVGVLVLSLTACLSGGGQGGSKKSNSSNAQVAPNSNTDAQLSQSGVIGRQPSGFRNVYVPPQTGRLISPPRSPQSPANPVVPTIDYPVGQVDQGDGMPGDEQGPGDSVASDPNLPPEIMPGCRSGNYYLSLHAVLNAQGACVIGARYSATSGVVSSGNRMPPGVKNLYRSGNQISFSDPCPAGHGNQYVVEYYEGDISLAGSGWTIGHTAGPAGNACPTPEDPEWNDLEEGRTNHRGWTTKIVTTTSTSVPSTAKRVRVQIMNKSGVRSGFGNCLGACTYTYWRQAYFPQSL